MNVRTFSQHVQILSLTIVAVAGISSLPSAAYAQVYRDFKGNPGQNSEAKSDIGLQPKETVRINGNSDLSTCIQANDGGCVYGITLTGSPGFYDYVLNVDAQGPSGAFSGQMYLSFTDESGDTYCLAIYSSTRSVHTVRYKSKKPAIIKIKWSNTGNKITSCP
ncbi:MAG: hypothetical protein ACLQU5_32265 [Isosphaeraceae bacterium]